VVVDDGVLLEEAVDAEALQLGLAGLAAQVVNEAAVAFEAAAEKIIKADRVANFEALAFGRGVDLVDEADALVANGEAAFRPQVVAQV
jgi:hypothetical protein